MNQKDIENLLEDKEIVGPLEEVIIQKSDGFFKGNAIVQSMNEAEKIANENGYTIICCSSSKYSKKNAQCMYEFYDVFLE